MIEIEVTATASLTKEEVWPEGDIPEVINPAAVIAALKAHGRNKLHTLQDWCILDDLDVTVVVNKEIGYW